ncbi:MAG: LCP family protein [Anaerolineae bacterium]|nr:LCP family protein [Anaerolineae bacterium]
MPKERLPRRGIHIGHALTLGVAVLTAAALASPVSAQPPPTPEPIPIPPPARKVRLPPSTFNVALLGVDKRPDRNFMNTDVVIIASVNPNLPAVTLLSIPRDTLVYVPGFGVNKINIAYALGGPDTFKETIRYNFGLEIDHYAMVNFAAVVHAVDALGGVEVIATCPLHHTFPRDPYYMGGPIVAQDYMDTFTGEVWRAGTRVPMLTINLPKPGVYKLNGLEALAYVRARRGIPGGDLDRGRREQRLVRALLARVRQLNSPIAIANLYRAVRNDIETDLSLEDLLRYAMLAGRLGDTVIRSFHLTGGDAAGVALDARLAQSYASRVDYIERALTVSLNRHVGEGIPIAVLNGTADAGFALAAADRLRELGFAITELRSAGTPYARTVVIDHTTTSKGNPVPLLLRALNLSSRSVVRDPKPAGPWLTVIVGPDFNPCYYAPSLSATGSARIDRSTAAEVDAPLVSSVVATSTATLSETVASSLAEPSVVVTATALLGADVPSQTASVPVLLFEVQLGNIVNVRSAPTLRARVIGRLAGGTSGAVEGRSVDGKWIRVRLPSGRRGWVSQKVVRVFEQGSVLDAASPATVPPRVRVPAGDVVNVRAGPGLDYRVIGRLRSLQEMPILGRSADSRWWQIAFRGRSGWVSAAVVDLIGDVSRAPVARR